MKVMIIHCIGDSLTEGDYGVFGKSGIANVHPENYPYFLSKLLHVTVKNSGVCGLTATSYLNHYLAGNVDVTDADIIVILLGTNGGQKAVGESDCNRDYRTLLSLLKRDAKKAKLVLCTPPFASENPEMSNCGYLPQITEAAGFVTRLCKEEGYPMIDLYNCPHFCEENVPIMQPNDGLHFTETGYKTLAEVIAQRLTELFPDMFE